MWLSGGVEGTVATCVVSFAWRNDVPRDGRCTLAFASYSRHVLTIFNFHSLIDLQNSPGISFR